MKVALKPKKTPSKKVSTPIKAKRTAKEKEISEKKKKSVAVVEKSVVKKKSSLKRKVAHAVEVVKDDVEDILNNIVISYVKKNTKTFRGKKIPTNILVSLMEKVFSISKESMLKWKYVYYKRIALERELSKKALRFEEIVELLEDAQVMKNVTCLSPLCPKLVNEFIFNILKEI